MTTLTAPKIEAAIYGQTLVLKTSYSNLVKVNHTQRQKTLVNCWYIGLSNQSEVENTISWLARRGYVAGQSEEKLTGQYEVVINWMTGPLTSNNTGETIEKRLSELRN
jgi:hypothetical protein